MKPPILVTAHRAGAARGPENTLAALRLAIKDGADMAEIDVRSTADDRIVVFHDADLRRVCGVNRPIREMPLAELQKLSAGRWRSASFEAERIPTLDDFIEAARGKLLLNIEIKCDDDDTTVVPGVVSAVERADFADACVLTSFNPRVIEEIRRLNPNLRVGRILDEQDPTDLDYMDIDLISVASRRLNPELIHAAHARKLPVHVWTVNDPDEMRYMIGLGIDNLITDSPSLARSLLPRG